MGEEIVARALSRFGEGITDFRPAWNDILLDFLQIEEEQFNSQGARGGTPWPALSPAYAAWKEKNFPGMPLLQLTQRMFGQFAAGAGLSIDIAPLYMRLTPTIDYPVYHQQGTSHMPARRVIQLIETDKMRWMKMLHNYVYDKAKEAHLL
jgi:hypothetical protein